MSLNRFFYPFRLNADVIYKATVLCAEDESFLRVAGAAGMNGHIAKPIDVPKLLNTLAGILN